MYIDLSLVLIITSLVYCSTAQSAAQIKAGITPQNSFQFVGLGGRYGYMTTICSKDKIIESDHFPPKSVYPSARDPAIKNLDQSNMAAVSLRYAHHRQFITTNNPVKGSAQEAFIQHLKKLFATGNYFDAINMNIGWYHINPDKDGNSRARFDNYIKVGIKDALDIHVINKLITQAQKDQLIQQHGLSVRDPVMTTILNLPLRDRAKTLIEADIASYRARH